MQKTSKTISVFIRNHQYKDGQGYRITTFGESNIRHQSCNGPMRESDTIDYKSFAQISLQDRICETNRDALKKLHMTLTEQEKTYSASEKEVQVTENYDEVEVARTEFMPKPKNNRLTRFIGLGLATLGAVGIILVFKKKRNGNLW